MFWRLFKKINDTVGLFNGHFVEAKAFYALEFDAVCCVTAIGDIDTSKAFARVKATLNGEIVNTYQHSYFDHAEGRLLFNNTLFVLTDKRLIELGTNWCQILHTPAQHHWANQLVEQMATLKIQTADPVIGFTRQAVTN